ncbi:MAG: phage major capsid protein, partial [Sporichthyaceae bacterium]|nr:phage major capsid protein [Sporichthyaceae bacterium]
EPNVVFIAPAKWETVRLLRTADGVYIWGHPAIPGPETIWGVPVVQTTAVTSTKAVIGDFRNFSELAVRRGIDTQISNSHSTFFVEGKLAIRADVRVALIFYRPKAFGTVTGL